MTEFCCKCLEQQVPGRIGEKILAELPLPDPASCKDPANLVLVDQKGSGSCVRDRFGPKRQLRFLQTALQPSDLVPEVTHGDRRGWLMTQMRGLSMLGEGHRLKSLSAVPVS